jgi:hypothetical protein
MCFEHIKPLYYMMNTYKYTSPRFIHIETKTRSCHYKNCNEKGVKNFNKKTYCVEHYFDMLETEEKKWEELDDMLETEESKKKEWKELNETERQKALKILKLPEDSNLSDIKKSFKKLALEYHPDKNPKGAEMYVKIQQAYEILKAK